MSDDTYKGLTAEQWHNAYQDLKRKYNKLEKKLRKVIAEDVR